jgi:hypothetical protein
VQFGVWLARPKLKVMVEGDDVFGRMLGEIGIERVPTKKPGTSP